MKVAIFGSFPEPGSDNGKGWELTGHSDDFKAACRQIGHELAKKRSTLVVESENPKVADPHVVAGYIDAAETLASNTPTRLRVEVAYSRGQHQPFMGAYNDHPGLVMYHQPIP